jgi:hypothetical protein
MIGYILFVYFKYLIYYITGYAVQSTAGSDRAEMEVMK